MSFSAPSKYRRHATNQLTPRAERRRGQSVYPEHMRLDPVESTLKAALGSVVKGGCVHNYGWGVTRTHLVVWELSGRPLLRHTVSLEGAGIVPEEAVVLFPWEFTKTMPLTCILLHYKEGSTTPLYLISLETGTITQYASADPDFGDFCAATSIEGRGAAVASRKHAIWALEADPTIPNWTAEHRISVAGRESWIIPTMLNVASYPFMAVGRLLGRGLTQGGVETTEAVAGQIVSLLYAPGQGQSSQLIIVLGCGRVVVCENFSEGYTKDVLTGLSEIYDRSSTNCKVLTAGVSYSRAGDAGVNLLVSYVEADSGAKQLSTFRIIGMGEGKPIFTAPVRLGWYSGDLHIYASDEGSEDGEPLLVLLAKGADKTQVIKMGFTGGEKRTSTRIFPSRVVAATSSTVAPPPEKLTFITLDGWTTESLPSLPHAAVKRSLTSTLEDPPIDVEVVHQLNLEGGNLAVKSSEVASEPVTDPNQWGVLTDNADRGSQIILTRIKEKYAKHRAVVEATRSAGLSADKLTTISDNNEKLGMAVALRELQARLYHSGVKWEGQEMMAVLTGFAKGLAEQGARHRELRLTPLQMVYTEAQKLHTIFGFLAQWCKGNNSSSVPGLFRSDPQYIGLVSQVVAACLKGVVGARHAARLECVKWTQALPILETLRELAAIIHNAAAESDDDVLLQNLLLDNLKLVCQFIITQERLTSIKRDEATSDWVRRLFLPKRTKDASKEPWNTYSYSLAKDIGAEIRDFDLLVSLALMLPEPERREELTRLHAEGEEEVYRSLVAQYKKEGSGMGLLGVQRYLGLNREENERFVQVVEGGLDDADPVKYAVVGPNLHTEKEEGDAVRGLLRLAERVVRSVAREGEGVATVRDRKHKLKLARFAAGVAKQQDKIQTAPHMLPLVVQKDLVGGGPTPMPHEELLAMILSGPEPGVTWSAVDDLSQAMHDTMHHKLAWAFPLAILRAQKQFGDQHYDPKIQREIWLTALQSPAGWWEDDEHANIHDLPEPQQAKLLSRTHFFNVLKTVKTHPHLEGYAFRGGKSAVLTDLQNNRPANMSPELLSLLIEVSDM